MRRGPPQFIVWNEGAGSEDRYPINNNTGSVEGVTSAFLNRCN